MRIVQATIVMLMLSMALFLPGVSQAFSLSLYETLENTSSGTACDICSVIQLPDQVYGGYVVLLDPLGDLTNQSTWSDVVIFGSTVSNGILQAFNDFGATSVQLLSKGCASGIATDMSCFPSYAQVTSGIYDDILETQPATVYAPYPNTYTFYSPEGAVSVPEPSSLLLLGSGLTAVGLWRRFKVKS